MNKNLYRIIFSKARNMFIAVGENSKSQTKASGESTKTSTSAETQDHTALHQHWVVKSLVASISLWMPLAPVYAQIQADPSANAANRPVVGLGKNNQGQNVPVVNIQTPVNGVSHNIYKQMDVLNNGVVLNNSRTGAGSAIVGSVGANPFLAKGEARLILNEINSTAATRFEGNLEVAGQRADVIIANPVGINIKGGGFINANKAIFTTGKPQLNADGSLQQFVVDQGKVTVSANAGSNLGLGGNNNNADYVDIYARALELNAQLHANQDLNVITGANTISASLENIENKTSTAPAPALAVDIKSLGGMYANNIYLMGNEKGLGVSNAGTLQSIKNLTVTNKGRLLNQGDIQTKSNGVLNLQAESGGDLILNGQIESHGSIFLSAENNIVGNYSSIKKLKTPEVGVISFWANNNINFNDRLYVKSSEGDDVYFKAKNIEIGNSGVIESGGNIFSDSVENTILDGLVNISAANINIQSGGNIEIKGTNVFAKNGDLNLKTIKDNGRIFVDGASLNSYGDKVLHAKNDINLVGAGDIYVSNIGIDDYGRMGSGVNLYSKKKILWDVRNSNNSSLSGVFNVIDADEVLLTGGSVNADQGVNIQGKDVTINGEVKSSSGGINIYSRGGGFVGVNNSYIHSLSDVKVNNNKGNINFFNSKVVSDVGFVSSVADGDISINNVDIIDGQKGVVIGTLADGKITSTKSFINSFGGGIRFESGGDIDFNGVKFFSNDNIEIFSNLNLYLSEINSNSLGHTAISSNSNIFYNSSADENNIIHNELDQNSNFVANGIFTSISKGGQNISNLDLRGGTVLFEGNDNINIYGNSKIDAIGIDKFKDHSNGISGDIVVSSQNGDVSISGGGDGLTINSDLANVSFSGQSIDLNAMTIKSKKGVNISSKSGDIILDAIKNDVVENKFVKEKFEDRYGKAKSDLEEFRKSNPEYSKKLSGILGSLQRSQSFLAYAISNKSKERIKGHSREIDQLEKEIISLNLEYGATNIYNRSVLLESEYSTLVDKKRRTLAWSDLKPYTQVDDYSSLILSGYIHKTTDIYSGGDINLLSSRGVLINSSKLDSGVEGDINIYSKGNLNKDKTSSKKEEQFDVSILLANVKDQYALGGEGGNYFQKIDINKPNLMIGKNINIISDSDSKLNVTLQNTDFTANDEVKIISSGGIDLLHAVDNLYTKTQENSTKSSLFGIKKSTESVTKVLEGAIGKGVSIKANKVDIQSLGGDIQLFGTQIKAPSDTVKLKSSNNLFFLAFRDQINDVEIIKKDSGFLGIEYRDSNSVYSQVKSIQIPTEITGSYIASSSGGSTYIEGTHFNFSNGISLKVGDGPNPSEDAKLVITAATATYLINRDSDKKSALWQSMVSSGSVDDFANLPKFNGPNDKIRIEGNLAIQVPIQTGDNREVIDVIKELSVKPGYEYLEQLVNNKDSTIDWSILELTKEKWNYKQQGLTPAGAAILVIVITALTAGAGSSITGALGYSATGTASAMTQAAITTLSSQASISLINNGGDVSAVLRELGKDESIKNLLASIVTAGLVNEVGVFLELKPNSTYFSDRLLNNFTSSISSTLVQTSIKGGNLEDNLRASLLAGIAGSLQGELANGIGDYLDEVDPNFIEYTIHKIAHAAAGCAAALATKMDCESSAIGAGVGEMVSGLLPDPVFGNEYNEEEKLRNRNTGKLIAGIVAAYTGYDVNTAANSADIAIENNNNTRGGPKRSLFVYLAKRAVNYLAPEKSADPTVVANYYLRITNKNILKNIDIDHIAQGHITTTKGKDRAVGFHHEPSGGVVARVKEVISKPDNNGVWEGTVEVYNPGTNSWVLKQNKSTFFPSGWSKEKLQFELVEVFKKGEQSGFVKSEKAFEAISPSGVKIRFVPPSPSVQQWRAWPLK